MSLGQQCWIMSFILSIVARIFLLFLTYWLSEEGFDVYIFYEIEDCRLILQPLQHGRFDLITIVVALTTQMHLQKQKQVESLIVTLFNYFNNFLYQICSNDWRSPNSFYILNIRASMFEGFHPFSYQTSAHHVFSTNFTDLTMNFSRFHAFSTKKYDHSAYFTFGGGILINKRRHGWMFP